jgi:hypothetical protein
MIKRMMAGCALLSCIAFAQDNRKPGLWEITSTMQSQGMGIPEDRLAKMTPEQRAQVEAMVSSQMKRAAQPTISKSCETAETIKREQTFGQDRNKSCKVTPISSSGSKRVMQISCDGATGKTEGTITVESIDPEHFTGTMAMHINAEGRKMEMNSKASGKWLGPNCGDVKPYDYSK